MIWQNPWAWMGLAALAIPVLIHLLGRRSARAQKFPSLRFLEPAQLMSTRRTRPTDLSLLVVRMGVVAAAVAALAAPLLLTENRERDLGRSLTRAIIVDTSASMTVRQVAAAPAERAVDAARREASALAAAARGSVVLETNNPAHALRGAVAWLGHQPGRRELFIVSDFQTGALDSTDLESIPVEIGIGLTRIETVSPSEPIEVVTRAASQEIVARATLTPAATTVEWTARSANSPRGVDGLTILAGAEERTLAEAARVAAFAISGAPPVPPERPIVVIHRGFEMRPALLRDAHALTFSWQGDVVARLRRDATLVEAASTTLLPASPADPALDPQTRGPSTGPSPFAVVARTRAGEPVIFAAGDRVDGRERLLLFVRDGAGSLASAALLTAIHRGSSPISPATELETNRIAEATLDAWRRVAATATSTRTDDDAGSSDGRWLWLLALLLLGVETWMRRGKRAVEAASAVRERAA